jgi:hypothetical protein
MKLYTIVLTLLLVISNSFASEQKTDNAVAEMKPCACGPIEHLLGKVIVRKYFAKNPHSGLDVDYNDEGVSANLVEAIKKFGEKIKLVDKDGNYITPQDFKDPQGRTTKILPRYLCTEYKIKSEILSAVDPKTQADSATLLKQWSNQYKQLNAFTKLSALEQHELKKAQVVWAQSFVDANGEAVCGECTVPNKKVGK